ncbi:transposase [Sporosarcina sp. P16b]|nr:transposase [Sporosarcina sp. P16b]
MSQKIYQIIAGHAQDDAANLLVKDSVFTKVLDTPSLASQPILSRFW